MCETHMRERPNCSLLFQEFLLLRWDAHNLGYRLHVRSRHAPQYLRPMMYIRRIRLPTLL